MESLAALRRECSPNEGERRPDQDPRTGRYMRRITTSIACRRVDQDVTIMMPPRAIIQHDNLARAAAARRLEGFFAAIMIDDKKIRVTTGNRAKNLRLSRGFLYDGHLKAAGPKRRHRRNGCRPNSEDDMLARVRQSFRQSKTARDVPCPDMRRCIANEQSNRRIQRSNAGQRAGSI